MLYLFDAYFVTLSEKNIDILSKKRYNNIEGSLWRTVIKTPNVRFGEQALGSCLLFRTISGCVAAWQADESRACYKKWRYCHFCQESAKQIFPEIQEEI